MTSLMNDFPFHEKKDWIDKVRTELKGKDPSSLDFIDENGLLRKAYYDEKSLTDLDVLKEVQAAQQKAADWKIVIEMGEDSAEMTASIKSLLKGADALFLNQKNIGQLNVEELSMQLPEIELMSQKMHKGHSSLFKILFDPIGEYLSETVDLPFNSAQFVEEFKSTPKVYLLIDGLLYREKGATESQEISFLLQHAADYFDILTEAGIPAAEIANRMLFRTGIGTDYLFEIAKCRALRTAILRLFNGYQIDAHPHLWGTSSAYSLSHIDEHSNLLRLSTMGLSAAIGNCDLIGLKPYNYWTTETRQEQRLSRNIQLLMKHESYLNRVNDIAAGSYTIENYTSGLLSNSWEDFLRVEKKGGMLHQLKHHHPFKSCEKVHRERVEFFKKGEKVMVGVNKYLSEEEADTEFIESIFSLSNSIVS
ncbi:MAG: hypothetical protein CMO34_04390 [Verrucomicrobia bacterium]|nr:hypothetical protein [Verrucomicrobiota bacterium]|tara:strand:- start:1 stop:1263 length:1263 start_codon:yes stop_codon:yes gene_type:complete